MPSQKSAPPTKKPRLAAVEYIRGISMLGVVGIHVGSLYMANTAANIYLAAVFEALTRFAVPIFFFISAFGLFYNLREPFSYGDFMRRRLAAVLVPYLMWSFFYVWHDAYFYNVGLPNAEEFVKALFFGTTKYHLYFLVVLLWFYALMPLFIPVVKRARVKTLTLLFAAQVAFDYWSSYSVAFNSYVYSLPDSLWRDCLMFRLNYWVLHYVFIFVLGGFLARREDKFLHFVKTRFSFLTALFFISGGAMFAHFVGLILVSDYTPVGATNTAHQLSPLGIVYTVAASLFFFALFVKQPYPRKINSLLTLLGRHSYFVYLAHPLVLTYLVAEGEVFSAKAAIVLYFVTVAVTLGLALAMRKLGAVFPLVNKLSIGSGK